MMADKSDLILLYYENHRSNINKKILQIATTYLLLSITWNVLFQIFNVPYSRANIYILLFISLVTMFSLFSNGKLIKSSRMMQQVVLTLVIFIICNLYMGSGYHEAWSFFLAVPLIAGLFGELWVLILYSIIGLAILLLVSIYFPESKDITDSIDISNRILLYIILATFSHLLIHQLRKQYQNQLSIINQSAETTIEQVVNSFVISIEAKDSYTFGHSERVSQYALAIASTLNEYQNKEKLKTLRLAGLLHDVGKINIPEAILTKPSKLTLQEYELIKTHPVVGARMVEKISGLGSLKPGVLYHHEKWDGTGYPTGIKGEKIPLDARILCIADAFDAMTSSRSYRPNFTFQEAIDELKRCEGTHFDPSLIDKLDDILLEWHRIYNELNDDIKDFEKLTDFL